MGQKSPLHWVLLRHDCPADYRDGPHWDLMLERDDVSDEAGLATWSLLTLPTAWLASEAATGACDAEVEAMQLDDHRAAYLTYEGPVSGGRGDVHRLASGELLWLSDQDDQVVARLAGDFDGVLTLQRQQTTQWRLLWNVAC
ncbi:hypothetical protein Pla108_03470 [Botrimarina colliarenosi]|uniref:Uncharacterized protein n=1 Tax=Botrimarina colliarenosi TaxID=2528001 RepID=A0A5C6AJ32_9BACT|nr:hypothetical protein [Botrimarina colliarenosi]TWT99410.1 hypothetical protein Pla108_03470 [Botrimarina colliarenosi]